VTSRAGYREWPAPASLRPSVACLWTRRSPANPAGPTLVLPDGCVDLIWKRGHGAFVAGPDTGPVPTAISTDDVLAGVRFWPGAGLALGVPLHLLRDRRIDLAEVDRDLATQLHAELPPQIALARLARASEELMVARPPDRAVSEAARLLTSPRTRVPEIERAVGLGDRQLRRRFDAAVGYGPKVLQRVFRFRRFLAALDRAGDRPDLARIAFEAGFADQAHLSRESARLAGMPPTALAGVRSVLAGNGLDPTSSSARPGELQRSGDVALNGRRDVASKVLR
jgi:AraC-like DNA-binding protein